jgi:uncharacterized protein YjbI with pentapeptide repeats
VKAFDDLSELPFASDLSPFEGEWELDGDYDAAHFDGLTLENVAAPHSRFLECAFTKTAFEGGRLRGARFGDAWLREVRLVGTEIMETGWQDAAFVSSVLAGVQAFGASLTRVVFQSCKLDSVNLRGASLTEVEFADCLLRDVDLSGATIKRASFRGCTLRDVDLTDAKLYKVDLRGAELGLSGGHESLRGTIIDSVQLLDLAPALADSIGITVRDS